MHATTQVILHAVSKGYILHDPRYVTFWKRQNDRDRTEGGSQGLVGGEKLTTTGQHEGIFVGEGAVLCPDCGTSMTLLISKTYRNVHPPPHQSELYYMQIKSKQNYIHSTILPQV